jgi:hypothetical protein
MAAKKKNDSSEENKKKKASPKTSPTKTSTAQKKPVAKKKPIAKKKPLVKKAVKTPPPVAVTDDDFGLEEVELQPIETAPEPAPVEKKKSTFVPASERPHEGKKNNNGIIITVVALIAIAAIYFLVLKPEPEVVEPEPVKVVQPKPVEQKQPEPEPEPEPVPEPLAVQTISARDGRFYVVVGSFYDVDFAHDRANDLIKAGIQSFILPPREGKSYYRVGINQADDFNGANSGINELKQTFGNEIWVLKH